MRIFSKFIFLCNLCFIASVILRFVENAQKSEKNFTGVVKLVPLESAIVVLGYGAILINAFFHIILFGFLITKAKHGISKWIIWFNFLFLLLEIYYFFFSTL